MNTIRKLVLLTAFSLVTVPAFAETKAPEVKSAQALQSTAKIKKQKVVKAKVHKKSGRSAKKSAKKAVK